MNHQNPNYNRQQRQQHNNISTAPYNFVPLNDQIVASEYYNEQTFNGPGTNGFPLDRFYEGKNTGYIEVNIETLSPLYIRDTLNEKEMEEREKKEKERKNDKDKREFINYEFFSPGGKPRLPGSSLRGMVRTLVEIMSYSYLRFSDTNRKFFYRALGDMALDLRSRYQTLMSGRTTNGCYFPKAKAGYLIKENGQYKIKPAKVDQNSVQYYRVEQGLVIKKLGSIAAAPNPYVKKVFFKGDRPICYHNHTVPLYYGNVSDIQNTATQGCKEGYLIISGDIPGKHMHVVINMPDNSARILLPQQVIDDYNQDSYRKSENLLKMLDEHNQEFPDGVPCFYIEENSQLAFGNTLFFRLPYRFRLKNCQPPSQTQINKIDIAEAIFGNELSFAGRVFFEDAFLVPNEGKDAGETLLPPAIPKILSEPKPTCFPHYLEQNEIAITADFKRNGELKGYWGLKSYDTNYQSCSKLRGFKLYWHKPDGNERNSWKEPLIEIPVDKLDELKKELARFGMDNIDKYLAFTNTKVRINLQTMLNNKHYNENQLVQLFRLIMEYDTQHTIIQPINPGLKFTSRIRFENLSNVELGALLMALDLPDKCAHKLGMAKPLGLGSVKISTKLFLSDRKTRYSSIISEWEGIERINDDNNQTSLKEIPEKANCQGENKDSNKKHTKSAFKEDFCKYVLSKITSNSSIQPAQNDYINYFWTLDRMKELHSLLSISPAPTGQNYLPLEEFKKRPILKKATKINPVK